jgi:hypothetical protein
MQETARRVLGRAVQKLGGEQELAARIGITVLLLRLYLEGQRPVPDAVLLRAVDIVLDELPELSKPGRPASESLPPDSDSKQEP